MNLEPKAAEKLSALGFFGVDYAQYLHKMPPSDRKIHKILHKNTCLLIIMQKVCIFMHLRLTFCAHGV